ncbi:C1 family peptidase [Candidatus Woesearchaeota archaeon]|nr:C1 family peptidase [Candidatus Woesearchaeota archaeon]
MVGGIFYRLSLVFIFIFLIPISSCTHDGDNTSVGDAGKAVSLKEQTIFEMVSNYQTKPTTWTMARNEFAGMTWEEFAEGHTGLILTPEDEDDIFTRESTGDGQPLLPIIEEDVGVIFDWRDRHGFDFMTDVKHQGYTCGTCWAHSILGAIEAHANGYYNDPTIDLDLSEQDLVSCWHGGCGGIGASQYPMVFNYIYSEHVATEECFPYTGTSQSCNNKCSDWQDDAWGIVGYEELPDGNIAAIQEAIIRNGPVVTGMISYPDFALYDGGIYIPAPGQDFAGHSVVLLGWGREDGIDYWIGKNSWGINWGEDGYFRIKMGACAIDTWFTYKITSPVSPVQRQSICNDLDNDQYCFWGFGAKPSYCPDTCALNSKRDCDDGNYLMWDACIEHGPLLLNPSFEVDDGMHYYPDWNADDATAGNGVPDGWSKRNCDTCSFDLVSDDVVDGSLAAEIVVLNNMSYLGQDVPVSYNKKYRVSGWIKTDCVSPNCQGTLLTECIDANHEHIWVDCGLATATDDIVTVSGTTDWMYIEFDVKDDNPNAGFLRVLCYNSPGQGEIGAEGTVYCDDFRVHEIKTFTGGGSPVFSKAPNILLADTLGADI